MGNYDSEPDMDGMIKDFKTLTDSEKEVIMNPAGVDEAKWEKAKKAAEESGHPEKWPLVMYIYKKMEGK